MALAIDGSTPAVATQGSATVATVTTASFIPPSGSLVLELYSANTVDPTSPSTPTITDSLGVHLTYTLSDFSVRSDTPAADGQAATWTAPVASSAAQTITVTNQAPSGSRHAALASIVLTGQHATPVGAHGKAGSISASSISQSYTSQGTGGWGFLVVIDWTATGAMTAGTGCTLIASGNLGTPDISYGFFRRTTADGSNGVSNTLNCTLGGAATEVRWAWIEILPAATTVETQRPIQQLPKHMLVELVARQQRLYLASGGPQNFQQALAGTVTSAGALAKQDQKSLASASTLAGALAKQDQKALTATTTPAGALTRADTKPLTGASSPAGALAKAVTKPIAGAIGSAGALAKQVQKALAGAITPAGALTKLKVVLLTLTAAITSSGTLTKQVGKSLVGAITSSGALAKQPRKGLTGTSTPAGGLAKQDQKPIAGATTPNGALATTRVIIRAFAGTITSAGTLTKQAGKSLAGAATSSATLKRAVSKALASTLTAAGSAAKFITRHFSGSSTPTGDETNFLPGTTARATSTPTVLDRRTSTATAAANRTSTQAVTDRRTSSSGVTEGRTSTRAVTDRRTSDPNVDGS